jgi:serine/threonine protein kinase
MPAVEQLCEAIEQSGLLPVKEVAAIRARWSRPGREWADDPERFARWLAANHYLSAFALGLVRGGKAGELVFDQYRVHDRLADGPWAGALLATDALQRPVVLDLLAQRHARDPVALQAFQQAARRAIEVRHPNVARTLDVGEARGLHYLVTEYAEGETLAAVAARRGRMAPVPAARAFALALAGLEALHAHAVPAGPLTLDCLLLAPAGKGSRQRTVKILHAGVGRGLFDNSALGAGAGDIPDDLRLADDSATGPVPPPGPDADLFRLGCSFYECLTGRPPFAPQHRAAPAEPAAPVQKLAPDVPEMLCGVVEQMIDPDPARRPRQAAHVAKALRIFLAAEEEARHPQAEENLVPPAPPHAAAADRAEEDEAGPAGAEGDVRAKAVDLWREVRPRQRDLIFLGSGALLLVLAVLLVKLLTGWQFVNVVCLLAGGALAFFVERLIRWREGEGESE